MSIQDMIDAVVKCTRCGHPGLRKCDCWVTCSCGWSIANGEKCTHPVHQTSWIVEGYWIIDDLSGKAYKTRSNNLAIIRKRMDEGTLFYSLKEARAAAKKLAAR